MEALFRSRPRVWIDSRELETVGGRNAWRTRVSEARRIFQREGGTVENRQQHIKWGDESYWVKSEYRFVPQAPLGRDSTQPVSQVSLF